MPFRCAKFIYAEYYALFNWYYLEFPLQNIFNFVIFITFLYLYFFYVVTYFLIQFICYIRLTFTCCFFVDDTFSELKHL